MAISPSSVSLGTGQSRQFTVSSLPRPAPGSSLVNPNITWSLTPLVGGITTGGMYTAPTSITNYQTVTVTATSVADPTKSAAASVTLNPPIGVTVAPAIVGLTQFQTQIFAATVTNTVNTTVIWAVSPPLGSITAGGVYTAPASITSSKIVNVTATSVVDPYKSASSTVILSPVNVTVTPASVILTQSQTQLFAATIPNTGNTAVTWSVSPPLGGITAAGLYTAPASITNFQTVTVKATSLADPSKSATVTVTLNPAVNVTLIPASVTLTQSQTQSFSATVRNTGNTAAVAWSLSPPVGVITAAGVYTAPALIMVSQTLILRTTSVEDPTKFASATVILNPPVNVTITPASVILADSQTQTFSARVTNTGDTAVTWSLSPPVGGITAVGLYTAPAPNTTSQTVTVKATSVADPTKSASATVTLNPAVNVTVTPNNVTLMGSQTQAFATNVSNTGNSAVTFSLSPLVGGITAAGVYTAPASIPGSQMVSVKATSVADPTKFTIATITLTPVTILLTPLSGTLTASKTWQFTATVGGASNVKVTWALSPSVGSISAGGLYAAPAIVSKTQTITVTAASVADPTKSTTGNVTLNPLADMTVSPSSVTLAQSQTQAFSVIVTNIDNTAVTWSLSPPVGSITPTGLYTAPTLIAGSQNVTVKATSVADPTKYITASVSLTSPNSQSGPVVWVVGSLYRVGTDDAADTGRTAQLRAGRGEYESFQIITQAPSGNRLTNVNVTVSDLTNPSGQSIAKNNVSLFREQYVFVSPSSPNLEGSNQPGGAAWYPDGLIPFVDPSTGLPASGGTIHAVPFGVSARKNQPVWVDVFVPRTAASGQYSGTYTVTSDQGSITGGIELTVWNFTLPLQPSLKSAFEFWTADSPQAEDELLRNKLAPLRVPPNNQPLLINNFGLGQTDLWYFSGASYDNCTMSPAPSISELKAAVASQHAGLSVYNYTADEIDDCINLFPMVQQWARNLHQARIDNLVTMKPVPQLYDDGSGSGRSAVDIWALLPQMYDTAVSNVQYVLAKGDKVWSYNSLVQDTYSPKWQIDFTPINLRVQPGFISQSLGLSGLLYWRVDYWSSDPWNEVNNKGQFGSNNYPGEGMLVYPGSAVGIQGVAPSMRLKWLRDGVEDYEYVEMLKKQGYGLWALQVAANVGPDWANWTHDPVALELARTELGQQLDAIFSSTTAPAN